MSDPGLTVSTCAGCGTCLAPGAFIDICEACDVQQRRGPGLIGQSRPHRLEAAMDVDVRQQGAGIREQMGVRQMQQTLRRIPRLRHAQVPP